MQNFWFVGTINSSGDVSIDYDSIDFDVHNASVNFFKQKKKSSVLYECDGVSCTPVRTYRFHENPNVIEATSKINEIAENLFVENKTSILESTFVTHSMPGWKQLEENTYYKHFDDGTVTISLFECGENTYHSVVTITEVEPDEFGEIPDSLICRNVDIYENSYKHHIVNRKKIIDLKSAKEIKCEVSSHNSDPLYIFNKFQDNLNENTSAINHLLLCSYSMATGNLLKIINGWKPFSEKIETIKG